MVNDFFISNTSIASKKLHDYCILKNAILIFLSQFAIRITLVYMTQQVNKEPLRKFVKRF